jgi:hypothetical protein
MSEFRKPYEYEEEKGIGGLLMLFFVMLLSVEVLLALAILIQGYAILKSMRYLGPAFLVLGTAYLALVLFTCVTLKRTSRYAVAASKILLLARVLFLTPAAVLVFTTLSRNPRIVSEFRSRGDLVLVGLVVPLVYILLFSGLWYWYFSRSRRVMRFARPPSGK